MTLPASAIGFQTSHPGARGCTWSLVPFASSVLHLDLPLLQFTISLQIDPTIHPRCFIAFGLNEQANAIDLIDARPTKHPPQLLIDELPHSRLSTTNLTITHHKRDDDTRSQHQPQWRWHATPRPSRPHRHRNHSRSRSETFGATASWRSCKG